MKYIIQRAEGYGEITGPHGRLTRPGHPYDQIQAF